MASRDEASIVVTKNGPYRVQGALPISVQTIVADANGESREWQEGPQVPAPESYALCRCGRSSSKPFCDGTHAKIGFDGMETASRAPYAEEADLIEGPALDLTDKSSLCVGARFCDPDGTIWRLMAQTNHATVREQVRHMGTRCPSGRLIVWDKTSREPIEPDLEPSIGLVQDPQAGVSGPLWVRGGVAIKSADGTPYEVRNRVTLCRCGASSNKPFCDGSHIEAQFQDGLSGSAPAGE